jgi:hypothetical protein
MQPCGNTCNRLGHLSHLRDLTSDIFVYFDDELGSGPTLKRFQAHVCVCVCGINGTHRPIILPVVLYECETWSLTLKEERRLRMFENRVLKKKRDEVTGEWRRMRNEELHDFYSPDIIRVVN